MAPWVGYVRVSHVGGRGGESFRSPTEQSERIEAWARMRGEAVTVLPAELDESGGRIDRPILTQAVEGIERGDYRGLVVAYLSRASRSVRHLLELWDRIESAGGEVVAIAESVDTSTPAGRLTRTMLAAIAEHELDLHRERFAQLRQVATAQGIWQHRQTPLGYSRDPSSRKLVPDDHAEPVRRAFARRVAGEPLARIAEGLRLTTSGARALLRNRVYLGELHVGDHVNPKAHPRLVDEDLWLAAQAHRSIRPPRTKRPPPLLAGLVRCASCGHAMSRAGNPTYICHRRHSAGACPAPAAIAIPRLDDHVERIALAELGQLHARAADTRKATDDAREQLRHAERELAAYLEGTAAAGLAPNQFAAGARARREAVDRAREKVASTFANPSSLVDGDPVALWPSLGPEHRNRLLRGLIEGVIVAAVGRGRRVAVEHRARVIAHGAGIITTYPGAGRAMAIRALALPDPDDPCVLRV